LGQTLASLQVIFYSNKFSSASKRSQKFKIRACEDVN
jgi:hypothetical protein